MAKITSAGQMVDKRGAASLGRQQWDTWPTYDAAVLGFRDYWYPVAWSKSVSRKPLALTLLGEKVMLSIIRSDCPAACAINFGN